MNRLLVLSNGAGEDAIAGKILHRLPSELKNRVVCCPLVGAGSALERDFELVGPRVHPPSEGLFRESWRLALKDLAQGVIVGHLRQLAFLRRSRHRFSLTVAVGDLLPVLWAGLAGCGPVAFVGTAKSVHYHPYSLPERLLLRLFCSVSLVRDPDTARVLNNKGVKALWHGNAMMDEVQPGGIELPFHSEATVLTLFPGSRGEAAEVLANQLDILELVHSTHPSLQAGVALAPGLTPETLVQPAVRRGWSFEPGNVEHLRGTLTRQGLQIFLLSGCLGDLLERSVVALGQAGTANEQAAGAGVPVVAYDPKGEKGLSWYRARQKGLLGDAVRVVVDKQALVADELQLLLSDPEERERRAEIGRSRMGPPGGCARMAGEISRLWDGA